MNLVTVTRTRFGKPTECQKLICTQADQWRAIAARENIIAALTNHAHAEFLEAAGLDVDAVALYDKLCDLIIEEDECVEDFETQLAQALSTGVN